MPDTTCHMSISLDGFVAEVPGVELPSALPERVLATLVRPGDEAVERDRHVTGGVRHPRPFEGDCELQVVPAIYGERSRVVAAIGMLATTGRDAGRALLDILRGQDVPSELRRQEPTIAIRGSTAGPVQNAPPR